jgi:serine phosphatase RsbU (regulator of sigma subunit)
VAETSERLRRAEEDREREAQELSAARVIQQQLLPKELPSLPGWRLASYYQPARAVGGDFYDFLELPDGLVEAHNPQGEMFDFPRLQEIVESSSGSEHLIDECLTELKEFVGSDWEQEDDITLVTLQRDRT